MDFIRAKISIRAALAGSGLSVINVVPYQQCFQTGNFTSLKGSRRFV